MPDEPAPARITFRYWVDDVTPPTLRLRTKVVRAGEDVKVGAVDAGSGVYADSIIASVDGRAVQATYGDGVVSLPTRGLAPGHAPAAPARLRHQESKNTENVARILPNTRWLTATFRVSG